ncbi:nuclease-related domain-containing protein [Streptomyces lichenis]|uniref:NERD domain-containing protein n=1 Tax=Streptomyces lichenis TaxID=2306967 RepID=A0ABT0I524_9ACTN|nr:nuclease-related domain-containing protein [Streptomyces lichenis]MCK8676409.1 NERD domain-containing protein [Streptomyces lichenis]
MEDLRLASWKRYGHDRLYVNLPDGTAVAWLDRKSGAVTIVDPRHTQAAHALLAPHTAPAPTAASPVDLDPLLPDMDLASHAPGHGLRVKLNGSGPTLLRRVLDRLMRRPSPMESWRSGLVGEKRVGAELNRLTRHGWRVLHSVPLPREVDIDHLLIGPGGVFTVNTKRHPGRKVWVGDDMTKVDHGKPHPYGIKSRAEARRAQRVLERHSGLSVPVQPVLVFVDITALRLEATRLAIRVYQEREVAALGPLSGVLDAEQVERLYRVARDRRVWEGA